jgi:DNA-binding XRE family transcriptional regulator
MVVKRRSFARARKAAGYTQEGLAEQLSVDRTTVARWEAGKAEPKPWQRPKIAEAFGLSLRECNQLLDDVGTTGHTVEVSAALVKAQGALPGGAYAAAQALQGTLDCLTFLSSAARVVAGE